MVKSSRVPSSQDLMLAERHIFAGIYGRLLEKNTSGFEGESANQLARAVTQTLFSLPPRDERSRIFHAKNLDQIQCEIKKLQEDEQIRRAVTDTLVIKAVFRHRQNSCAKEEAQTPIEKIKELGIFLEGENPPTPLSFVQMARDFYAMVSGKQHH